MSILHVILLAIIQGMAELLPVSSSAHVVVAEKLMGMDPTAPQMTLLLVMLHTGTMFAVIAYFWTQWRRAYFHDRETFRTIALQIIVATFFTGLIGGGLIEAIEKLAFPRAKHAEIEQLFGRLDLIAPALAMVGILILIAGLKRRNAHRDTPRDAGTGMNTAQAGWIGAVQGLCLPFRGFSRSGATISTGMLLGVTRNKAEVFSFALAVVLTPPAIAREVMRLVKAEHLSGGSGVAAAMMPSLLGALFAFLAGLLALKWLSRWLETGRWHWFGVYCLIAAGVVAYLHRVGY
ncbi:MAG TPA: undecaprenyl-diphosphate phosphatase [Acidobacteriaceae bacterium]|nr:undecaprenyl-diphosphate phosphatase [Acidobacteriaceae bacterium]